MGRKEGLILAEYIVVCESLKIADWLIQFTMQNVTPKDNFKVDYYRHRITDSCGDIMQFVSTQDVATRHVLTGFRGPILSGYAVENIVSDCFRHLRAIRRLAAIPKLIEEKEKKL